MKNMKFAGVAIGVVLLLFVAFLLWQFSTVLSFAEPLTVAEAEDKVTEMYNGKIVEVKEQNEQYRFTIEVDEGIFEVAVSRKSGDISSLKKLAGKGFSEDNDNGGVGKVDELPGKEEQAVDPGQKTTQPQNAEKTFITESEAISIALSQVPGEVDDVEMQEINGVMYYLIEVDREEGNDGTVKINAISGEVVSIFWND